MPRSAPVDGFRLAYDRHGAGRPVVLLHGWPGSRRDYREVVARLRGEADLVVPDLRGFGDSDRHATPARRLRRAPPRPRACAALISELGLDRPVLAGYDVGSRVAQTIAREAPDEVAGLVLSPPLPGVGERILTARGHARVLVPAVPPARARRAPDGAGSAGRARVPGALLVALERRRLGARGRRARPARRGLRPARRLRREHRLVPRGRRHRRAVRWPRRRRRPKSASRRPHSSCGAARSRCSRSRGPTGSTPSSPTRSSRRSRGAGHFAPLEAPDGIARRRPRDARPHGVTRRTVSVRPDADVHVVVVVDERETTPRRPCRPTLRADEQVLRVRAREAVDEVLGEHAIDLARLVRARARARRCAGSRRRRRARSGARRARARRSARRRSRRAAREVPDADRAGPPDARRGTRAAPARGCARAGRCPSDASPGSGCA